MNTSWASNTEKSTAVIIDGLKKTNLFLNVSDAFPMLNLLFAVIKINLSLASSSVNAETH